MTDSSEQSKRETSLIRGQSTRLVRTDDSLALRTLDEIGKLEESRAKEPSEDTPAFESPFEEAVYGHIVRRGYRVVTQFPVLSWRVDLVVEGRFARLGVDCDGARYMLPPSPDTYRMFRDESLEGVGFPLVHILSTTYFRDPEGALAPLWEKLGELGILPHQELGSAPKKVGP